ncbi:outer membrane beta-barrel family protein [Flavobacterium sp. NKUCC04_CG]|uniref:outer membrane beta-barrel family protein n=1 Tax=Flavobacterium sp. NKUCC04_CG TaxID=2842121 RepID=UPI001C5B1219|nr:outer membrane beta-barrel family protein [Flavobacterium sp. NKUCC04_CG]MBW3517931.1 outer membrane beta-barrel protein [Flavobacterium sp. NKUCC04_CG]
MVTRSILQQFFFYMLVVLCHAKAYGQQYTIKGKVVNMDFQPVDLVHVTLIKEDDNSPIVVLTDGDGRFIVTVEEGNYTLILEYYGSEFLRKELIFTEDIDLGTFEIDVALMLNELTINVAKKIIERKVDRLVFNLENSVIASSGDVLDALNITPGILVQNGQISMVGKSSMGVMLNGRIINLAGDDLVNFLKNLRTETIKSIEVISSPSAKYDAQGNSGLINIITKAEQKDSFHSTLSTTLSQSKSSTASVGGNLNFQKNKLTLTSSINYSNGSFQPYQAYTLNYPKYIWKEESFKLNYLNNLVGRFSVAYKINNRLKIGGEYSLSNSLPLTKTINSSLIYNNIGVLDSTIVTNSRIDSHRLTKVCNVFSVIEVDTFGRKINLDFDYLKYNSATENIFGSKSFYVDEIVNPSQHFSALNKGNLDIEILTSRVDFEYPTNWIYLNFGTKLSFINNKSDAFFFDSTSGNSILDPTKSNVFIYKENTQAFYFSVRKQISEFLTLKAGFRGENTLLEGHSLTIDQVNNSNYFKLFPTFYLNYSKVSNKSWALTYNKRINRPSYNLLNPFRFYSTSFNYTEGNAFLQPYYTNNIELSYMYNSLYTMLYASFINNGFDQVVFVEPDSYFQRVIPINFYNQTSAGLYQSYGFNLKRIWDSRNNISLFYKKTTSNTVTVPDIEAWTFNFSTTNSLRLDQQNRFRFELIYKYNSPSVAGSYLLSAYHQIDLGFRMLFLNNKCTLTVNGVDILKTNRKTFSQTVNGISQHNFDYADIRRIRLSLAYNFGKSFKMSKKEEVIKEEKQRIN